MKESKSVTKDPICGMTVDEAVALNAVRNGKTFHVPLWLRKVSAKVSVHARRR